MALSVQPLVLALQHGLGILRSRRHSRLSRGRSRSSGSRSSRCSGSKYSSVG